MLQHLSDFLATYGELILFAGFALVTLVAALLVALARRVTHACLSLLPCFIGIAALYAMLASPVMLAFQLLIYAGGIMVLLLFAIFLLERRAGPITASNHYVLPAGFTSALLVIVLIGALRLETFRDRSLREPPLEVQVSADAGSPPQWFGYYRVIEPEGGLPARVLPGQQPSSNVARTGFYFLTYYLLPFELTSLILVVAMVGAILLARREKGWVAAGRMVEPGDGGGQPEGRLGDGTATADTAGGELE